MIDVEATVESAVVDFRVEHGDITEREESIIRHVVAAIADALAAPQPGDSEHLYETARAQARARGEGR